MLILFCELNYICTFVKHNEMNFGTKHIKIMIYAADHPPPHCHVIRKGVETRVVIPTLEILTGPKLTKEEEAMILEKIEDLCDAFDKFNPDQHIENE